MKKYLLVIAIISIAPSVTLAAWWNPIDWFGSGNTQDQAEISTLNQTISQKDAEIQQLMAANTQNISQATSTDASSTLDLEQMNVSLKSEVASLKAKLAIAMQTQPLSCPVTQISAPASAVAQTPPAPAPNVPVAPIASQTSTISSSAIKPASITFSGNDPTMPPSSAKSVSVTTNGSGQYLGLPVLSLYLIPSSNDIYLHTLTLNLNSSGQGTVNTAYLYQGSVLGSSNRPVATGIVTNGTVTFTINPTDPQQIQLGTYSTNLLTVKVDVSGLAHSGDSEVTSASVSNITANSSSGQSVNVNGSASGNVITVQQP